MRQYYPLAFDPFVSFAEGTANGLLKIGGSVGVFHNTEPAVRGEIGVARDSNTAYQAAVAATVAAVKTKDETALEVREFISRAREVIKRTVGPRYSVEWREAGFLTPSLRLPRVVEVQQNMLTSLQLYFTKHPEQELAAWGVTADRAGELHAIIAERVSAVSTARATQRELKVVRDAAVKALRWRMRKLRQELKQLLAPNDPRWLDFGFCVPADKSVPDAPEAVTIAASDAGEATLSWEKPANTDRFHIYNKTGDDAEFVRIATVTGTSKRLDPTPAGAAQFYVTALNSAGESRPSEIVEWTIPAASDA